MAKLRLYLLSSLRFLGRLAIAAAWVFAVALIIWNLARLYPGDHWSLVRLGDFNTTDQTENCRLIANRLNDVH